MIFWRKNGDRVLIINDLLVTSGIALAATKLIKKLDGEVFELAFIVELPDLKGGMKLKENGFNYYAQTSFEGE